MTAPRRALVVVDVQQEYFEGPLEIQYPPRAESLANIVNAVETATMREIPVLVVQHQMPQGAPVFVEGTEGWSLHAHNVDTITIVGYMTNNCDLATAVEAEGLGFATEILSDATGAISLANEAGTISAQSLHTALMVLLQSNFAAVSTTAQWIEALTSDSALPKSNLVQSAIDGRSAVALA
jgi:nicotinamidase-related amidase